MLHPSLMGPSLESPVDGAALARPALSVVIPVYRSSKLLPRLLARLDAYFEAEPYPHQIVFVNDGSPDDSWRVLEELAQGRDDIVAIDLMRNYGQHTAMLCGLAHSTGDFVITMDDDLQNPPEEIGKLVGKIQEGYDVVFGRFQQKMHGAVRRLGTRIVDWLNRRLFQKPRGLTLTNFRIIRREVVDAVCAFRSTQPYLPGLLLMTGKSFANVTVEHHPRSEGQSNYGARVILMLIWRIVINYSAFPLRLLTGFGLVVAVAGMLYGGIEVVRGLVLESRVPGWTTLVVLLSLYQGLTLLILGAMGEYVIRILRDTSSNAYRIRRSIGVTDPG